MERPGPLAGPGRPTPVAAGSRAGPLGGGPASAWSDLIVASDLDRALTTAAILAEGLGVGPVLVEPRLRERSAGEWSGLTRAEIDEQWPGYLDQRRRPPGFEPDPRSGPAFASALDDVARDHPGAEVLVVSHGGVVYVLEEEAGLPFARLPNLSGRWVDHQGDRVHLGDRIELVDHVGPVASGVGPTGPRSIGPPGRHRRRAGVSAMALPVEVVRSPRRRKTVSAEIIDGVVRVRVPSWMNAAEIDAQVAELVPRLERRLRSEHVDLMAAGPTAGPPLRPARAHVGRVVRQPTPAVGLVPGADRRDPLVPAAGRLPVLGGRLRAGA